MKIYQHYHAFGVLILILASPIYANFAESYHDDYQFNPMDDDISFQDCYYPVLPQMDNDLPFEPDFYSTEISLDMSDQRLYDIDKIFHHEDDTINSNEPPFSVIHPNHLQERLLTIDIDLFEPDDIPIIEIHELTPVESIEEPNDPPSLLPISVRITNLNDFYKEPIASAMFSNSEPEPDLNIVVDITVDSDFDNEFIDPIDEPFDSSPHFSPEVRVAKMYDFYSDPFMSEMFESNSNPDTSIEVDVNIMDNTDNSDSLSCSDSLDNSEEPKRGFFKNMRSKFSSPPKSKTPSEENSCDAFESVCVEDEDEPVSDSIKKHNSDSPSNSMAQNEAIKDEETISLEEEIQAKKSMVSRLLDLVPHPGHVIDDIIDHYHHDKKPCDIDHFMEVVLFDLDLIHDLFCELETLKPTYEVYEIDIPEDEDKSIYVESHSDPSFYGPHYMEQTRNSVQFHSNQLPSKHYGDSSENHPISSTAEYFHDHYDDYLEPDIKHDLLHFVPRLVHTGHNIFTNIEENIIQAKDAMFSLMPDFRRMRYQEAEPAEPEYIPDEISSFYDSEPDVYEELWIRQHHPEYNTVVDTVVILEPEPNLEVVVEEEIFVDPYCSYLTYEDTFDEEIKYDPYYSHKKPCYEDCYNNQPPYIPHAKSLYYKPMDTVALYEPNIEVKVKEEVTVDPYNTYLRYQDTFDEEVKYDFYHPHQKPCYEDIKIQPPYNPYPQNMYYKPVDSTYVNNNYYVEQYPKPTCKNNPPLNQPYPYLYPNQMIYGPPIQSKPQYPSPTVKRYPGFRY